MPVSAQSIDELHDKCSLSAKDCRAALTAHDGNVDAALAALIDEGRVKPNDLNPDTVSDELFDRAAKVQKLALYRQFTQPGAGLLGMLGKLTESKNSGGALDGLAASLAGLQASLYGNKTPEQLMAEDEAKQAERFKQAQKVIQGMKGRKPMSAGQQARLMAQTQRRSAWLKANPLMLKLPPFPPLKREMHEWTGRDVLSAWAGTHERHGGYTSRSSSKPSTR